MNYFSISKYRSVLMGLAIAWVMYFHTGVSTYGELGWLFHRIGFYGVDIFLFLSGVGVYFSLKKRPSVTGFYKARLSRILPAYLIVACAYYLLTKFENGSFREFFFYISGIGYWIGTLRFDWYIPTQLLFYIFAPMFLVLYNKLPQESRGGYTVACMSASPFLCVVLYYMNCTYLWGSSVRLAVFLLGIHMGSVIEEKRKVSNGDICAAAAMFLVGALAAFFIHKHLRSPAYIMDGLNAYPALLMAPSACLLISTGLDSLSKKSEKAVTVITYPLKVLGKYSLEIYLLHQRLQGLLTNRLGISSNIVIIVLTIAFAIILGYSISLFKTLCSKIKLKKA